MIDDGWMDGSDSGLDDGVGVDISVVTGFMQKIKWEGPTPLLDLLQFHMLSKQCLQNNIVHSNPLNLENTTFTIIPKPM